MSGKNGSPRRKMRLYCVHAMGYIGLALSLIVTGAILNVVLQTSQRVNQISIINKVEVSSLSDGNIENEGNFYDSRNVRLLCWIMTSPNFLWKRAIHVKKTWGPRCDKTLYFSSIANDTFPAIGLNVSEGRKHLTAKSHHAFRYIYKHYFDEYDWFLKADDNTYVIVENMRYFLSHKNTSMPLYFGHHFQSIIEGGYASGGAGYILNKESLRRLVKHGSDTVLCRQDGGAEDVEIGKCLHNLGVMIGDTYDSEGKSMFHCFNAATHIMGSYPSWYKEYDAHGAPKGMRSMSKNAISFHYMTPEAMYVFDYLLYHVTIQR